MDKKNKMLRSFKVRIGNVNQIIFKENNCGLKNNLMDRGFIIKNIFLYTFNSINVDLKQYIFFV